MAFVNSISFSHRFSSDGEAPIDICSYQEINHVCSGDNVTAVTRSYFQFMLACGYSPSNICDAMEALADEYREAWGYNEK